MKNAIVKMAADWLAPHRSDLAGIRAASTSKAREHDEAVAERHRLVSLRAPREDLLQRLGEEIEALGRQWATGKGAHLVATLSGTVVALPSGAIEGIRFSENLANVLGEMLSVPAACYLFPEQMKAGCVRILDGAPDYDAGEPMATRLARIAEVDARITETADQHQALVDAAREFDLTIQPLEVNRVRQLVAQQREAREKDQIARHNAVNAEAIRRGTMQPATRIEQAR